VSLKSPTGYFTGENLTPCGFTYPLYRISEGLSLIFDSSTLSKLSLFIIVEEIFEKELKNSS
jgi:hypothetical protein